MKVVHVYITAEHHEQLKRLAQCDRRHTGAHAAYLLERAIEQELEQSEADVEARR